LGVEYPSHRYDLSDGFFDNNLPNRSPRLMIFVGLVPLIPLGSGFLMVCDVWIQYHEQLRLLAAPIAESFLGIVFVVV